MCSVGSDLHVLFFPLMAPGHMLPMVDIAKLFAYRGIKTTIVTTPANVPLIQPSIDRAKYRTLHPIELHIIPFPSAIGLPEGCENLSSIPNPDMSGTFSDAVARLSEPFEGLLERLLPDCTVTDMFLPWTCDVATKLTIPRLVFHGLSFFSLCVWDSVHRYQLLENLPNDVESFVIPGLPHKIEMLKSQVPDFQSPGCPKVEFVKQMRESEEKSYGVVVNSFYELEPDYAQHYRKVVGRKAWHIGPVVLCNNDMEEKFERGSNASIDSHSCLSWLDVIYVCFGSLCEFTDAQLREIALGLEASNHPFIWAVRRGGHEWIPEGYEERVRGKGLIIKGWAPQILILNHPAVGGFVTHCGWNSSLEGISAGLPLATWPLFAEQFSNEKLIVEVLKIGVAVGGKQWSMKPEDREVLEAVKVEKAVNRLMGEGEEASERRRRAKELGEMARKAVEIGGSSYVDLDNFIQEMMNMKNVVGKKQIDRVFEK